MFWPCTKRTVPFKTFLVPVPFPLVTTFETAGTVVHLWKFCVLALCGGLSLVSSLLSTALLL